METGSPENAASGAPAGIEPSGRREGRGKAASSRNKKRTFPRGGADVPSCPGCRRRHRCFRGASSGKRIDSGIFFPSQGNAGRHTRPHGSSGCLCTSLSSGRFSVSYRPCIAPSPGRRAAGKYIPAVFSPHPSLVDGAHAGGSGRRPCPGRDASGMSFCKTVRRGIVPLPGASVSGQRIHTVCLPCLAAGCDADAKGDEG